MTDSTLSDKATKEKRVLTVTLEDQGIVRPRFDLGQCQFMMERQRQMHRVGRGDGSYLSANRAWRKRCPHDACYLVEGRPLCRIHAKGKLS